MRKTVSVLSFLLAVVLLFGCDTPAAPESTLGTTTVPQVDVTPTTTTTAPPPMQYNALTGLEDIPEGESTRWVGVMIGNDVRSRPQVGLDSADMYVETQIEGGVTRIMAVFGSPARVPAMLGPTRSARTPFVNMATALDLFYCHAGGSAPALARLREVDIDSFDARVYEGSLFWREQSYIDSKGYEYSMMTNNTRLMEKCEALGYESADTDRLPFTFGDTRGAGSGKSMRVYITTNQAADFDYEAATGLYTKTNVTFGEPELHVTANGNAIQVSNVIVMYAPKYMENEATSNFDLSAGRGILLSGGTSRYLNFTWSESKLSFTEENGDVLALATGKTYICIVESNLISWTTVE